MFNPRTFFTTLALASVTSLPTLTAAPITGFDDISLWYGSGPNRSALVLDWNDGTPQDSFAWGFRWSGSATGEDLFRTVAGSIAEANAPFVPGPALPNGDGDPNLALFIRIFDFGSPAPSVDRVTYSQPGGPNHDQDSNGFNDGFWSYWNAEGTGDYPASWTEGPVGFADRSLADGSWDGFSFVEDFTGVPPSAAVAAVPEPSAMALIVLAAMGFTFLIRRRAA